MSGLPPRATKNSLLATIHIGGRYGPDFGRYEVNSRHSLQCREW